MSPPKSITGITDPSKARLVYWGGTEYQHAPADSVGYQTEDAGLTDIAGLAVTDGNIIVGNGTNWVAESGATARTSLGLGTTDAVSFGASLTLNDASITIVLNNGSSNISRISGASGTMIFESDINNVTAGSGFNWNIDGTARATLTTSRFGPSIDQGLDLGSSGLRFFTVYASVGTINTSDAREKTPLVAFSPAEIAASKALAAHIGMYQWLPTKLHNDDRTYCGLTVQKVMEVMESHGLDPLSYGFIRFEEFTDPEPGNRYSLMPDNILMFIAKGVDARLSALESGSRGVHR